MKENQASPLDERWDTGDLIMFSSFVTGALLGLVTIALVEGGNVGALLVLGPLLVIAGYESGLIQQFKWEVRRRVWPTTKVPDE
jgi:VIT1/CCC1 family predicted Fe2+/Mn2+ transporter